MLRTVCLSSSSHSAEGTRLAQYFDELFLERPLARDDTGTLLATIVVGVAVPPSTACPPTGHGLATAHATNETPQWEVLLSLAPADAGRRISAQPPLHLVEQFLRDERLKVSPVPFSEWLVGNPAGVDRVPKIFARNCLLIRLPSSVRRPITVMVARTSCSDRPPAHSSKAFRISGARSVSGARLGPLLPRGEFRYPRGRLKTHRPT
jgi:hypothetical protein